jgi:alpha-ketoglutarate-dependent taurine dioxygenase
MSSSPASIRVVPTGATLGADIEGIDLSRDLSAPQFAAIHDAWMEHQVLRFRGQRIDDGQLVAFSRRFGELDRAPVPTNTDPSELPEFPEVLVVSNVRINGKPIGSLGNYESDWHTDMSYNEACPSASILYSIEIPPEGGDTGFASMYRAYETLPAATKTRIETLRCRHDSSRNSAAASPKSPIRARRPARSIRWCAAIPSPAGARCSSAGAATPMSSACPWRKARHCSTSCGRMRRSRNSAGTSSGASAT